VDSVTSARTRAFAFQAAAPTSALARLHGKQVMSSVELSGKALAVSSANDDLRRDERLPRMDDVYRVQAQVEPQPWNDLGSTSLIAPTPARMAATEGGVSGPHPWRRPV